MKIYSIILDFLNTTISFFLVMPYFATYYLSPPIHCQRSYTKYLTVKCHKKTTVKVCTGLPWWRSG